MAVVGTKSTGTGLTFPQALAAAQRAGRRAGDTAAFDSWMVRSGLYRRGTPVQRHLRAAFEGGVDAGIAAGGTKRLRTQEFYVHGVRVWWDEAEARWRTSLEPESLFDSPRDAAAFARRWKRYSREA